MVGTNRLVGVNRVASMKWVVSQEGYFVLLGRFGVPEVLVELCKSMHMLFRLGLRDITAEYPASDLPLYPQYFCVYSEHRVWKLPRVLLHPLKCATLGRKRHKQ